MPRQRFQKTLLCLALCAALPAWAGDSMRIKELEQKLESSLRAMDALQRPVDQLDK